MDLVTASLALAALVALADPASAAPAAAPLPESRPRIGRRALTVEVVDARGSPVPRAGVAIEPRGDTHCVGADGRVTIDVRHLPPAGAVHADGFASVAFVLDAPSHRRIGLRVVMQPGGPPVRYGWFGCRAYDDLVGEGLISTDVPRDAWWTSREGFAVPRLLRRRMPLWQGYIGPDGGSSGGGS